MLLLKRVRQEKKQAQVAQHLTSSPKPLYLKVKVSIHEMCVFILCTVGEN